MNIDIVLFAGRIVLVALLYIFLFAVMKTGVGLVRGQRRDSAIWTIDVDKGPRGIRGIHVDGHLHQRTVRLGLACALFAAGPGTHHRGPQLA
mgnify:CR=1 FL=1